MENACDKARLSVAPMMDWTDRHDRVFLRHISAHARLYTEMVTTGAILHGNQDRLLGFDAIEHPVALQLGGADPTALAESAAIGAAYGYDEINLNCGCPSDRVQNGYFGACLMADPALVARCVTAMIAAVDIPVTVKCRIGIDDQEDYADLAAFVRAIADAGCETIIVHARKAWLQGLSPKENREIPPLKYDIVYHLKQAMPDLTIVINGGITTADAALSHLDHVDGVMIGREAYQNPYFLAAMTADLFDDVPPAPSRHDVARAMVAYAERMADRGVPVKSITRHMMGLFQGLPGARAWRRHLSTHAPRPGAGPEVIEEALALVPEPVDLEHAA